VPYYVYKIHQQPIKLLELVQEFDSFKPASAHAKTIRASLTPADSYTIKVIHADNQLQAEDLLNQVREPQPRTAEDY
jgi:hypothetical protein